MEAVAWTAIGLLGATQALLLASVFHLGQRIDAHEQSLRESIDAQGQSLREAIEAQGQELRGAIEAQTARIDALNGRMDAHLGQHMA